MNIEKLKIELCYSPLIKLIPDKLFCRLHYRVSCKRRLDLKNPKTFNEKLTWLKLFDHKPLYTKMVDKYEAKKYVADLIGDEYIIPMLGVYDKFEEIDFGSLPNRFVIKCTHDSGSVVVCKNKDGFDPDQAKKKINKSLKRNYYYVGREWPYKNVKPRVLIEEYKEDSEFKELRDYKLFCFDGKVRLIQVDFDRFIKHKRNLYSPDWEYQDVFIHYPNDKSVIIPKPTALDEMIKIAEKLSKGIPHLRVDLYQVDGKVFFGELSFYHGAGYELILPEKMRYIMGEWIDLSKLKTGE